MRGVLNAQLAVARQAMGRPYEIWESSVFGRHVGDVLGGELKYCVVVGLLDGRAGVQGSPAGELLWLVGVAQRGWAVWRCVAEWANYVSIWRMYSVGYSFPVPRDYILFSETAATIASYYHRLSLDLNLPGVGDSFRRIFQKI